MMDELRDYRFYADDMIHPSDKAVEYIFEKFGSAFFSKETIMLNSRINKIIRGLNHKVFSLESVSHFEHLKRLKDEIKTIQNEHDFIDFKNELKNISDTISEIEL